MYVKIANFRKTPRESYSTSQRTAVLRVQAHLFSKELEQPARDVMVAQHSCRFKGSSSEFQTRQYEER